MSMSRSLYTISIGASVCLTALAATACQDGGAVGPDHTVGPDPASSAWRGEAGQVVGLSEDPQPVPFKGTFVATSEAPAPPPLPDGCEIFLLTTEAGNFTHLGSFTGVTTTCGFNVQVPVLNPPINPGGGPPPYFVADFVIEATYTAANEDLLQITGEGVFVQSLTDGRSGSMGFGVIEGGTGRFAGATGEFDWLGVLGVVSYNGWIIYDASS